MRLQWNGEKSYTEFILVHRWGITSVPAARNYISVAVWRREKEEEEKRDDLQKVGL